MEDSYIDDFVQEDGEDSDFEAKVSDAYKQHQQQASIRPQSANQRALSARNREAAGFGQNPFPSGALSAHDDLLERESVRPTSRPQSAHHELFSPTKTGASRRTFNSMSQSDGKERTFGASNNTAGQHHQFGSDLFSNWSGTIHPITEAERTVITAPANDRPEKSGQDRTDIPAVPPETSHKVFDENAFDETPMTINSDRAPLSETVPMNLNDMISNAADDPLSVKVELGKPDSKPVPFRHEELMKGLTRMSAGSPPGNTQTASFNTSPFKLKDLLNAAPNPPTENSATAGGAASTKGDDLSSLVPEMMDAADKHSEFAAEQSSTVMLGNQSVTGAVTAGSWGGIGGAGAALGGSTKGGSAASGTGPVDTLLSSSDHIGMHQQNSSNQYSDQISDPINRNIRSILSEASSHNMPVPGDSSLGASSKSSKSMNAGTKMSMTSQQSSGEMGSTNNYSMPKSSKSSVGGQINSANGSGMSIKGINSSEEVTKPSYSPTKLNANKVFGQMFNTNVDELRAGLQHKKHPSKASEEAPCSSQQVDSASMPTSGIPSSRSMASNAGLGNVGFGSKIGAYGVDKTIGPAGAGRGDIGFNEFQAIFNSKGGGKGNNDSMAAYSGMTTGLSDSNSKLSMGSNVGVLRSNVNLNNTSNTDASMNKTGGTSMGDTIKAPFKTGGARQTSDSSKSGKGGDEGMHRDCRRQKKNAPHVSPFDWDESSKENKPEEKRRNSVRFEDTEKKSPCKKKRPYSAIDALKREKSMKMKKEKADDEKLDREMRELEYTMLYRVSEVNAWFRKLKINNTYRCSFTKGQFRRQLKIHLFEGEEEKEVVSHAVFEKRYKGVKNRYEDSKDPFIAPDPKTSPKERIRRKKIVKHGGAGSPYRLPLTDDEKFAENPGKLSAATQHIRRIEIRDAVMRVRELASRMQAQLRILANIERNVTADAH